MAGKYISQFVLYGVLYAYTVIIAKVKTMINTANEASIDSLIVADRRVILQNNPLRLQMWG